MPDNSAPIPAAGIPSRARLVARVSSRAPTGSAANRWHKLTLWTDSGRYWLSVDFRSTWEQERPRVRVFPCIPFDRPTLAKLCESANPCADYSHAPRLYDTPAPGFTSKAHKIDSTIRAAYSSACDQLIRDCSAWFPPQKAGIP